VLLLVNLHLSAEEIKKATGETLYSLFLGFKGDTIFRTRPKCHVESLHANLGDERPSDTLLPTYKSTAVAKKYVNI